MDETIDKTALSYWFPLLEKAGLPVPRTIISLMPLSARESVWAAFDAKESTPEQLDTYMRFIDHLNQMVPQIGGFPCFLRTDHTSAKHNWENTCYVKSAEDMHHHVFDIIEYSEMVGIVGIPWDVWAVREFLPTIPLGVCESFGNMPVCREFRFFIDDGALRCVHPYWPMEALEQGDIQGDAASIYAKLSKAPDDILEVSAMAAQAGAAVGGSWSIDILETRAGWVVTDMAEAHKSYHWEGCEHAND